MRDHAVKRVCCLAAALLCLTAMRALAGDAQAPQIFDRPAPLAAARELLRRTYTPLAAQPYGSIAGLPLDLRDEHFAVYVPAKRPAGGYGLMVFVPPWDDLVVPPQWRDALDRAGVIFVSAGRSGNDQPVRTRRMALALIAATNIMARYNIDPAHVLVAGLSGGSRVALRLALAYPDLFRGALLNAGSDPIGTSELPLPPAPLFRLFQSRSRLYYLTGNLDIFTANLDRASQRSLRQFCVAHVVSQTMWDQGHVLADTGSLARALDVLLAPLPPPDPDMTACRSDLDARIDAGLREVRTLMARGDKAEARRQLDTLDARYGGLAAPQSLTLNAALTAPSWPRPRRPHGTRPIHSGNGAP